MFGALALIRQGFRHVASQGRAGAYLRQAVSSYPYPWGLIVAVLLTLGSIPFFLGLTIVMPLLGHATWHLYRKAIESPLMSSSHEPEQIEREKRYAADFPSVLLPPYGRKHRFFDSSD